MRVRCVFVSFLLPVLPLACGPRDATPPAIATGDAGRGGMAGSVTGAGGGGGAGGEGGGASCGPGVASATGGMMNGGGGGAAMAGSGGMSGGAGTAPAGGIAAGVLYPCPEPPPSQGDACPNESITCTYPGKKSCACYNQAWNCADCPTCQPATTTSCSIPFRVSLSCNYGNVTCSCERRSGPDGLWRCGVCPTAEPLTGDLCGNVAAGDCRYGADRCSCGTDGKWSCATESCPANPIFTPSRTSCTSPKSAYTCRYQDQDQDCICLPNSSGAVGALCSCPASRPVDGGACIGSTLPCVYGDVSCTCAAGWRCTSTTPPNPCPLSQPGAGEVCGVRVSTCAYGSVVCACDGTSWSCS